MSSSTDREAAFDSAVDHVARELAEKAQAAVTSHPEPEELIAYQERRLEADAAERLRQHLVDCPSCAREMLELEDFDLDAPTAPDLLPSPEATARDWEAFERQVAREHASTAVPGAPEPAPRVVSRRRRELWQLAASLLIGLSGLAFWIAGLARTAPSGANAPSHPFVFDLVPDGEDIRRDAAMSRDVAVPVGMDSLIARLYLGDQTPHDAYRAEILDAGGTPVWSQPELKRQPAGQFAVLVERGELDAGSYRLRLVGTTGSQETVLATYGFDLQYLAD